MLDGDFPNKHFWCWPVASVSALQRNVQSWVNSGSGGRAFETALLTDAVEKRAFLKCLAPAGVD